MAKPQKKAPTSLVLWLSIGLLVLLFMLVAGFFSSSLNPSSSAASSNSNRNSNLRAGGLNVNIASSSPVKTARKGKEMDEAAEHALVEELLHAMPPQPRGERAEWNQGVGLHRKEDIFAGVRNGWKKGAGQEEEGRGGQKQGRQIRSRTGPRAPRRAGRTRFMPGMPE